MKTREGTETTGGATLETVCIHGLSERLQGSRGPLDEAGTVGTPGESVPGGSGALVKEGQWLFVAHSTWLCPLLNCSVTRPSAR